MNFSQKGNPPLIPARLNSCSSTFSETSQRYKKQCAYLQKVAPPTGMQEYVTCFLEPSAKQESPREWYGSRLQLELKKKSCLQHR